jgi:two-component system response regulator FlrC
MLFAESRWMTSTSLNRIRRDTDPCEATVLEVEPKTIWIVGEEGDTRSYLARALLEGGFDVETFANGRQALARLSQAGLNLIVAVSAGSGTSAGELLQAVSRMPAPVPVIVVSMHGTVADAVAAVRNGANDYLSLPTAPEHLVAAARHALALAETAVFGRQTPQHRVGPKPFITHDPRLLEVLEMARRVACSTATVLIHGESGTGKELLAAYIHRHGLHPEAPYVAVNCAALPETLAESELFGHEKGAFTGAVTRKIGKFELAKKGTLVLDEIGEMTPLLQAKLLRVLQEREIDRVGGSMPVPIEARVVAITNRDLSQAVAAGSFREDLYYRLNVVSLIIPPLRERPGDVPLLADHFLAHFSTRAGKKVCRFSEQAMHLLSRHPWKGNVRELANRVERAVLLADSEVVQDRHLGLEPASEGRLDSRPPVAFRCGTTVWEMERQLIMGTLSEVDQNRTRAAELLGISIRTLRNKLREYRMNAASSSAAPTA